MRRIMQWVLATSLISGASVNAISAINTIKSVTMSHEAGSAASRHFRATLVVQ